MAIEALSENVVAQLRSSFAIDSITQCVTELVLNSLDAKATSIAVRVNCTSYKIQVVDNGKGITRPNLEFVGQRYMTNKCHTLSDLKKRAKFYGFKGESLASISEISRRLIITTRQKNCDESHVKTIEKERVDVQTTATRPSFGTTVTVEGFLYNLPVRQRCVKNSDLDAIKHSLESLVIIHPGVSLTLRNDANGKMLLASVKSQSIASSFETIHPHVDQNDFTLIKVSKNKTSVKGLIHRKQHENKRLQYVYVNKRPIHCPRLQSVINSHFKGQVRTDPKKKHLIFVVDIKCPCSEVDFNLEPTKTTVFFKKFDVVERCVEKIFNTLWGKETTVKKKPARQIASEFGVSQIGGAVRGVAMKRKSEEIEEVASNKSPRISAESSIIESVNSEVAKQVVQALPIQIKKNDKKDVATENEERFVDLKDNTLFTNFPDNEEKGKNIIMDMFIMSLEVYPKVDQTHETICPNASNDFVDKNESLNKQDDGAGVSIGIQTNLDQKQPTKALVSVATQTDVPNNNDASLLPWTPPKWLVSDCDSKTDSLPAFHFNPEHTTNQDDNFDQTKKLFNFANVENMFDNRSEADFSKILENCGQNKQTAIDLEDTKTTDFKTCRCSQSPKEIVQKSPYFPKEFGARNIFSRWKTQLGPAVSKKIAELNVFPRDILTQPIACKGNRRTNNLNEIELTFIKKSAKKSPSASTTSKFFTPMKPKSYIKRDFINKLEDSGDLFVTSTQNHIASDFVLTLDDQDKQKIMDKDLQHEKKIRDEIMSTLGGGFEKEITHLKPTTSKLDFTFEMAERFYFVPKGLSPILKKPGAVPELSPEARKHLQNAVIESYDDELLLVKWRKFTGDQDPRQFLEEIYRDKSRRIEGAIPNISKTGYGKRVSRDFENMSFPKNMFRNLDVVGQVDCKFIAAFEKNKKLLILFDQHAVHERVRLEELTKGYKNVSTKLGQDITIFMPCNDLNLIKRQKVALTSMGLRFKFITNGIIIYEVPLCVYNKSKKGTDIIILIETLIKETVDTLKENNGILVNTPKLVQNIINSEACRGAIKFGDQLSKNECIMHLKKLGDCDLPFQCAHGRPTLTPLLSLDKIFESVVTKPHLKCLKRRNT